jgi:hypothetical protein
LAHLPKYLLHVGKTSTVSLNSTNACSVTINELVPFKHRILANGYAYIWGLVASGFAPVIAYAFVYKTSVGWRGVFYLLIAMNAVGTASWYFFYHPPTFNSMYSSQNL